mmetsp:Transcript_19175/g.29643  ORF Transcript_19175/g.29643 Transcript_19175/m.29643 type:complete len:214 (+) Transcript_19175:880-1521(+)
MPPFQSMAVLHLRLQKSTKHNSLIFILLIHLVNRINTITSNPIIRIMLAIATSTSVATQTPARTIPFLYPDLQNWLHSPPKLMHVHPHGIPEQPTNNLFRNFILQLNPTSNFTKELIYRPAMCVFRSCSRAHAQLWRFAIIWFIFVRLSACCYQHVHIRYRKCCRCCCCCCYNGANGAAHAKQPAYSRWLSSSKPQRTAECVDAPRWGWYCYR